MQVAVSYDANGKIFTLFEPSTLKTDKGFFTYVPAKGEKHEVLDVPGGLEGKSVFELASLLHVNITGPVKLIHKA
jgi:hypothetical protein